MFDRKARFLFDQVAAAYDEARPSYPQKLIDKLIELSGLSKTSRILEIGCGTGQITRSLAERGYDIVAVELGEHLAQMAADNLAKYPHVQVIHSPFESWDSREQPPFDLVLSAQAFHWIDPGIGYPKIRQLLGDQGHLAVVYNFFPGSTGPVYEELDRIYKHHFPSAGETEAPRTLRERVNLTVRIIKDCGLFHDARIWDHAWVEAYTSQRYLKLLESFSDHRSLSESVREKLYHEIRDAIVKHGGVIDRPLLATLFLAKAA